MKHPRMSLAAFAAVLWLLPAHADEPQPPTTPKVGDLLESQLTYERTIKETVHADGEAEPATTSRRHVELTYVDRVEEVRAGRVVAVTRHFKKARLVEDGLPVEDLRLAGRNISLRRSASGGVQGTWAGGSALLGNDLTVAELGPWPDVARSWALELGTRSGTLEGISSFEWERPREVPSFVEESLELFAMPTVTKGSWKVDVSGTLAPAGRVSGKLTLEGREENHADGESSVIDLVDTVELTLVRSEASAKELPEGKAPPAEELREDDPEPMPEEEEEPDPPEPEEDPFPEDDDDDESDPDHED